MWKFIQSVKSRWTCRCTECGAAWPCFKAAGYSIAPWKWTCSPECYELYVDRLIESASPGLHAVHAEDGTHWEYETCELLRQAGAGPSMRMKLECAVKHAKADISRIGESL
jgi:hypothetical protein